MVETICQASVITPCGYRSTQFQKIASEQGMRTDRAFQYLNGGNDCAT
jgi:hypothetical protein